MLGSRRKIAALFERLRSLGVPQAQLDTVCTPIGFDLGGETPEELAIAILAQILLVKKPRPAGATDAKGGQGMIWLTGAHTDILTAWEAFCREQQTTTDDILIILGDSGFNFGGGEARPVFEDARLAVPHHDLLPAATAGNRPQNIPGYVEGSFHGGKILCEPQYPNLLFAVDGEVYRFAGTDCLVVGGAYSTGKEYRLVKGLGWWPDEQPSGRDKAAGRSPARAPRLADARRADDTPARCAIKPLRSPQARSRPVDRRLHDRKLWMDAIESRLPL